MNDAYSILGVSRSATPAEIRRAYHRLALQTHPDKLPPSATPASRASSEEHFKLVANAYEVLIDPDKRAKYDAMGFAATSTWDTANQRSSRDTFRAFFGAWDDDVVDASAGEGGRGGIVVEEREAEDAINLPLFEGYLVLDPRSAIERAADSVASAIACNMEDIDALGWEGWFARAAENDAFCHDRPSPIIVLGGSISLAHSLLSFLTSCAARDPSSLPSHVRSLSSYCRRIWFIRGGTSAVLTCLPCLRASLQQLPTPHVIAPGLLLGSRAVPWDRDYISTGLGVTHVVVAKDDGSVSAVHPGLDRLELDVSDDAVVERSERLFAAWERAVAFIDGATKAGGRVLVRVHGRSRSAGIVLAWMARAHCLPVAMTARILRSKCPSIDWNLANVEAVVEWLRAFEGGTSICV